MNTATGYKQTEIGIIPEDWVIKSLNDISEKISVGIASSATHAYRERGIVLFRNQNIKPNYLDDSDILYIDPRYEVRFINKRLKAGDLLTARTGYPGTTCIVPELYENSQSFTTLITRLKKKSVDTIYISHYINSAKGQEFFEQNQIGGGQKNVNAGSLKSMPIILPPLPEQTAIANALSDMDALIAQTEKLIEKKKAIKQGVMQELLKPKEGWVTKKLGEVCEIIMGQSPLSEYYNFAGIGLPLIQGNADIKNRKTIIRTYSSNITKKGKLGDIIMTVRAPVGEIALSTFECCLGRGVCALRYENDFMYHYMISIENYWSRLSSGSTFDSVNSNQIRDLSVTLPQTKNEQIEIAKTLTDLDKDIELTETKLQKLKHQKQGMMQALLTGKIRLI
ncbi:MAG: restriction endonuclease subunit S [Chitinophagales bacterium]